MHSVLIIQTAFIGDVILATALIEKIHAFYPDAQIDFLVRKGNEDLLKNHPFLRNILVWNKQKEKYKNLTRLSRKIRESKYEYVVNLQRFAATGLMTILSGAKHKIGFSKNPFSFLYTRKINHEIGNGRHEVVRNLRLIAELTDNLQTAPKLYPSTADFQKVSQYTGRDYICIAPTSVWFTKQLEAEKWIEFINKLSPNLMVFLLGAPSDKDACQHIIEATSHKVCKNLAGELTLLQSAALLKKAKMNYVNDSAPMHLASAMNAPVTAIFCSTIPAFGFTPLSDEKYIIETSIDLSCRPCGLHGKKICKIGTFDCSKSINMEEMLITLQSNSPKQ